MSTLHSTSPPVPHDGATSPSGLPKIDRIEKLKPGTGDEYEALGWRVPLRGSQGLYRFFADDEHGGTSGALEAARAYRDERA